MSCWNRIQDAGAAVQRAIHLVTPHPLFADFFHPLLIISGVSLTQSGVVSVFFPSSSICKSCSPRVARAARQKFCRNLLTKPNLQKLAENMQITLLKQPFWPYRKNIAKYFHAPLPATHCLLYTVLCHKERGGGEKWTREKFRGATVHTAGLKIPPWLTVSPVYKLW